ncbi:MULTISPECIES: hypothetical protein [unclassified Paenibacillus]|uniref:hypothetical protein n=1 Tax=unclassified Paenibacillus TaxID=185978 RepID=UPI0009CBC97D|nr:MULTISPECIES: hypothetical protein [unclassified Paenibacillus]SLJ92658.1 hypothetical protein SAMN06272722_1011106 [Paenibacillus sp. RU5A]SOC58542.1 hypothetical protein SAMN05880581_10184 [Paenibacillus sp. RU26A]SOC67594.1 hypothetical protein SAMN05880586_10184 [Paenibacillus sp. RU5M]
MKFYFQLDGDIIRDVITYPYDGYTEVELGTMHLPAGINAGYYRLQDGVPVLDQALKDEADNASRPADYVELDQRLTAAQTQLAQENAELRQAVSELSLVLAAVMGGGE